MEWEQKQSEWLCVRAGRGWFMLVLQQMSEDTTIYWPCVDYHSHHQPLDPLFFYTSLQNSE